MLLKVLSRIVQKVSMAKDLNEALGIIVSKVQKNIGADVCSVYLQNDDDHNEYILMATNGLNQECIGQVVLSSGKGLVGMVAEKGDLINVGKAQEHPDFKIFPHLKEQQYNSFCAIPIIYHKNVLGILVVQSIEAVKFSQEEVSFLLTIASQLSNSILHAKAVDRIQSSQQLLKNSQNKQENLLDVPADPHNDHPIYGSPVSPGVAIGLASLALNSQQLSSVPDRFIKNIDEEIKLFLSALQQVKDEVKALSLKLSNENLPKEDIAIFDAYILMLDSESFINKTVDYIKQGNWAAGALRQTIDDHIELFHAMENRYMQERIKDLSDLGQSILDKMLGSEDKIDFNDRTILVAEDFSAMTLSKITPDKVKGIISVKGSGTSHIAIIARAMGIPTVMGVKDIPLRQLNQCELIIDGYSGKVFISPSEQIVHEYRQFEKDEEVLSLSLLELKDQPARTTDGITIPLYVNLGIEEGIGSAKQTGAEGVGLFRTEFPFMSSQQFPDESEQIPVYKSVLESFSPDPVTLRTLDIGGDKSLPYFPIKEDNPFLGWRGIRISLDHPEIFIIQLRAMLIANCGLGNLHIMLPMISTVDEIDEARLLVFRAYDELYKEGYAVTMPRLGVMIEVPSLIFQVNEIIKMVDFISIGTNDLIQYLLAVDRNNSQVSDLYQSLHPAVLLAINKIIKDAHKKGVPVSVCGEMASDPFACILLMGMEIDALSTNVAALPRVKWVIREFSQKEAKMILSHVLKLSNAESIKAFLELKLEEKGLAGLVRAGS